MTICLRFGLSRWRGAKWSSARLALCFLALLAVPAHPGLCQENPYHWEYDEHRAFEANPTLAPVDALCDDLQSPDARVRNASADSLLRMGEEAIPALIYVHARDYTSRRPRADAIAALLPRFGLAHIPRLLGTRLGREAIVAMGPSAIPALVSQVERDAKYYSVGSMPMGATFALSKITPGGSRRFST